jgi:hypothetical protein
MYNLNISEIVASYNASFRINTAALYASIEDGSYDEMNFNGSNGLYVVSNRKAQVCHMFDTLPKSIHAEVMTLTKGYAVTKVINLVIEYNAQKVKVAAPVLSEVEVLRAQVAELQNEVTNRDSIIANRDNTIHMLKSRINSMVATMNVIKSAVRTVVLQGKVTQVVDAAKLPG